MQIIECPVCRGSGEVAVRTGAKTIDFPDGVYETAQCQTCSAAGGVPEWFAAAVVSEAEPSPWWDYQFTGVLL